MRVPGVSRPQSQTLPGAGTFHLSNTMAPCHKPIAVVRTWGVGWTPCHLPAGHACPCGGGR